MRIATASVTQPFATGLGADFSTETPVEVKAARWGRARRSGGSAAAGSPWRRWTAASARRCAVPADATGFEPLRIGIGWLVVGVASSPELDLDCLSLSELRRVWRPGSTVDRYELYGAARGTAAFELFTREVSGRVGAARAGPPPRTPRRPASGWRAASGRWRS
jgi:hypothetical protein